MLSTEGRTHGGFGLFSIRERMRSIGGTLEVTSTPGRGTSVRLEFSVPTETSGRAG